ILIYKLLKILIKALIVAIAGFIFPYLINYLNIGLPISADINTGIHFALGAIALLLIYEFFHFILYFLKIITWPFRLLLRRRKK
ncbi:MAG: hypothetical protein J7K26_01340, partial [Candidatus Aenigmarchaeota archaeon]|nr:hypothetical protein [Candidatus Aenigmarchaeota archaeon]